MLGAHLIVNVFNGEKYLEETIEALVNQDYKNVVIHCIDNHSTDGTADIIRTMMNEYNNVKYYKTPNHVTLVKARNFAIKELRKNESESYYFGFCDADDLCEKNWVSSLMRFSDLDYDLLISNGFLLKDDEKIPVDSCLSLLRPSPFACPVYIRSCLFNSQLLTTAEDFFDDRFPIIYDTELWIRKGKVLKYLHISDHLFYKRVHDESMAGTNYFPILIEKWRIKKLHKLSTVRFVRDYVKQVGASLIRKK